MGGQVFVDESKAGDYLLIAAIIPATKLAVVRKMVRRLVLPGQGRIHMKKESDTRRKVILAEISGRDFSIIIYRARAGTGTELERRQRCISRLVHDAAIDLRTHICLERDDTLVLRDNRWLRDAAITEDAAERLYYRHDVAGSEPLLALPDIVGWAWARGGMWRHRCNGIPISVVDV